LKGLIPSKGSEPVSHFNTAAETWISSSTNEPFADNNTADFDKKRWICNAGKEDFYSLIGPQPQAVSFTMISQLAALKIPRIIYNCKLEGKAAVNALTYIPSSLNQPSPVGTTQSSWRSFNTAY
jgi:hypothetical protein